MAVNQTLTDDSKSYSASAHTPCSSCPGSGSDCRDGAADDTAAVGSGVPKLFFPGNADGMLSTALSECADFGGLDFLIEE